LKLATHRTALAMLTPKTLGGRVPRQALVDHRPHNAFAQILGKRHSRRLLRAAVSLNHNKSESGIAHDSLRSDGA
jgi:hypothetical protein